MFSSKLQFDTKIYYIVKVFWHHKEIFLLKPHSLQYNFNVLKPFITISYFKFNLKLKADSKMCTFKKLKKFVKPKKCF